MFLRREEVLQLFFSGRRFWQRYVLPACEAAARRVVDGPGEVSGGEDKDAGGVADARGFAGGGPRQIAPLYQKLGFYAAGGFVFAAGAGGEEGIDFVDEDDAWGERLSEGEEGANEFFAFAELREGQ